MSSWGSISGSCATAAASLLRHFTYIAWFDDTIWHDSGASRFDEGKLSGLHVFFCYEVREFGDVHERARRKA